MKTLILALLFMFMASPPVQAEHVVLFSLLHNRSVPHFYFDSVVERLQEGDSVEFSNHKIFHLGRRLDTLAPESEKGARTIIFELENYPGYVIRLPKKQMLQSGITQTIEGHRELAYLNQNIVKILDAKNGEYAIVEKLSLERYTFLDLIINESLSIELQKQMMKALIKFAKKTAQFSEIDDFNATQFVYDVKKKEWVLFDWTEKHQYFIKDQQIAHTANIWEFSLSLYLKNFSWDEEDLNISLPDLTSAQKEKVVEITKRLISVTEKERDKMMKKLKIGPHKSCNMLMREFL